MSYATTAPLKYDEDPGTEDILEDIKPPVKLSAVDKVFPDFFNIFPISDSIEFTDSNPIIILHAGSGAFSVDARKG